jgi:hypothetical protein
MGTYKDSNVVDRVVLVIVLASGVGDKNSKDVQLHTEKSASELVITITWPKFVCDIKELHQLFTEEEKQLDNFVLRKQALVQQMAMMRPTKNDPLKSVARIPLPIEVEPNIHESAWRFIGDKKGTRVLYIDLKAPSDGKYEGQAVKECKIKD